MLDKIQINEQVYRIFFLIVRKLIYRKNIEDKFRKMKKKYYNAQKLPLINPTLKNKTSKVKTVYEKINNQLNSVKTSKSNSICDLLTSVRHTMKSKLQDQKSLQKIKRRFQEKQKRKQSIINKKQKKVYYYQTTPTNQNQVIKNQNLFKFTRTFQNIQVHSIAPLQKPPHRQKTAMCYDNDKIYLYGGIGCQPNLRIAQFNIETQTWRFPQEQKYPQHRPTIPISGHSFTSYKGKGFIYGGSSNDLVQQLSIVNFSNFTFTQGQKCLYRRKNHAVIMISKYMVVQGGIQSNILQNNMYYYDTEKNYWGYFNRGIYDLPYLSHHSMACTFPSKTKKRINALTDLIDPIYLFGGKDKNEKISNILYRVFIQANQNIRVQTIQCTINPQKRFSCCFHYVGNSTLLLYGGKNSQSQQQGGKNSYNNVFTFNTQKLQWNQENTAQTLPNRYGMASTAFCGKIYIFGGFVDSQYSDANITTLSCWTPDLLKSKSNFGLGTRSFLSGQKQF